MAPIRTSSLKADSRKTTKSKVPLQPSLSNPLHWRATSDTRYVSRTVYTPFPDPSEDEREQLWRDALLIRAKLIWEAQNVDGRGEGEVLGGLLQVAFAAGSLETGQDGVALLHLDSTGRRLICEGGKWVVLPW